MRNLSAKPKSAVRKAFPYETPHKFRDKFSRDRDRILYSTEFRRLDRKTQVFVSSFDDNNRNRLTHTIEVVQLAKTITKYFKLNQELTEAIAYGHDVGHTPFGHTGERVLNLILNGCDKSYDCFENHPDAKGFKHNWQGLRVLTSLEKIDESYDGLNLTDFTLWGILHHTNRFYNYEDDLPEFTDNEKKVIGCDFYLYENEKHKCKRTYKTNDCFNRGAQHLSFYTPLSEIFLSNSSWTIEALIVRMADEIAQRHHDIEDGINANIMDNIELIDIFYKSFERILKPHQKAKLTILCRESNKHMFTKGLTNFIITLYVDNLIQNTESNLPKILAGYNKNPEIFHKSKNEIFEKLKLEGILNLVGFAEDFREADRSVKDYLKYRILNSHLAQTMDGKSTLIIKKINDAYLTNPSQLPDKTITTFYKNFWPKYEFDEAIADKKTKKKKTDPSIAGFFRSELRKLQKKSSKDYIVTLQRTIGDFIAGMTDSFALRQYEKLYGSSELKNY